MKRLMQTLFGTTRYVDLKSEERRREEEEHQFQEVRERLERVAEEVSKLDRRRAPREATQ